VQPAASLDHDELEVLHRIGHVDLVAIDSGLQQRRVQQLAGGSDEGMPRAVLQIPRNLADEHDIGGARAFAEDGLGRIHPEIAPPATPGRLSQLWQSGVGRNEVRSGSGRDRLQLRKLGHRAHGKCSEPPEKWRRSPSDLLKAGI
jgi:hypothetical protein